MNGCIDNTKARHINVVGKMGYVTLSAIDGRGGQGNTEVTILL